MPPAVAAIVVAPPAGGRATIINLMDALRESVAPLQPAETKPPKKMAPSKTRAASTRTKKIS
jgi:hypothetical protein